VSFIFKGLGANEQRKGYKAQAAAAEEAGQRAMLAGEAEAKQLETRAKQGVAVGSYNADLIKKRAESIIATQRARAAAGGGDTTDVSVQAITDETIREAGLESMLTMAEAEDRARQDRYAAKVSRYTGISSKRSAEAQAKGYRAAGRATLLSGIGDMIDADWSKVFGG